MLRHQTVFFRKGSHCNFATIVSATRSESPTFLQLSQLLCETHEIPKYASELDGFLCKSTIKKLRNIDQIQKSKTSLRSLLLSEPDNDMKELYKNEIYALEAETSVYDKELEEEFFEYRNRDIEEVLVEIRAGSGGAEAALFAGQLCDLYKLYFQFKNWKYHILSESSVGAHTKEIILSVQSNCYAEFSGETGVHRVQRVPETESQGRIHTSTVSVAIIPQKFKNSKLFEEKDIRMDVYRSSGPGGQNVNKTNSAVRLVHLPTGITVCMQDERSQIENRLRAYKVLKHRLEERERSLDLQNTKAIRMEQIGAGERSEKIRTYNFPQNRISDHRISWTSQNLAPFFKEPQILDELISKIKNHNLNQIIQSYIESFTTMNK